MKMLTNFILSAIFVFSPLTIIFADSSLPFSLGVVGHGNPINLAGRVGLNGEKVPKNMYKQTMIAFNDIESTLKGMGFDRNNIAYCKADIVGAKNMEPFNNAWVEFFSGNKVTPARSVSFVKKLPLKAKAEISCVAYTGGVTAN